ncbi:MAG: leucine-rich repeat domain-containing protein [Clostridia bacterium]|nr:leucine-rich repeat domain-containing protein [Clostridia bacterium]
MKKLFSVILIFSFVFTAFPIISSAENADMFTYEIYDEEVWITGYNGSEKEVLIPETVEGKTVTAIDSYAFRDNKTITSVSMPDTITYIGNGAFQYCTSLEYIKLSKNTKKILGNAFHHCISLKELEIPQCVTEMEGCSLGYYEDFKSGDVFVMSNFTIKGYTNSVAQIYAADHKMNFVSVGVASPWIYEIDGVYSILLKYVGLDSVITIPSEFENCPLYVIAGSAFAENERLTSVTIPEGVATLNQRVFYNCKNLKTISIPTSVNSVGSQAFKGTPFYSDEKNWQNDCFYVNNVLIEAKPTITSVKFKEYISTICDSAFKNCIGITSVTIPATVQRIESEAFSGCTSLKEVKFEKYIPDHQSSNYFYAELGISSRAFENCTSLKSMIIPSYVMYIARNAIGFNYEMVDSLGYWSYVKVDDFKIYGEKGSEAEAYATQEGFTFIEYDFSNEPKFDENCDHTTIIKNKKQATYFGAGYTGDKVCETCSRVLEKGKTTAKLTLKVAKFKLTKGKKQFKVKYTKVADATGFQVRYKLKGKWKTKTFNTKKTATKIIKKLKKGNYQVQIRAMVVSGIQKAYSAWSKTARVRVK